MNRRRIACIALCAGLIGLAQQPLHAADNLQQLAEVSLDNRAASQLCRELQASGDTELIDVLSAMKDTSAVAKNWYLSVAQTVADRNPAESRAKLTQFLPRLSEDPTARFWAFQYITRDNEKLREQILESMLADPSMDLRFEAVKLRLGRIENNKDLPVERQVEQCQELLSAARLPSQVQDIAKRLNDLDVEINLLEHLGFLPSWNVCASFNNVKGVGFDTAYAPEKHFAAGKLSTTGKYDGKNGQIGWQEVSTDEPDGKVDLNPIFEKEKGAVAYAATTFNAESDLDCEIRIGTPNACKVWLNGELVISREVYHTGSQIDQYRAPAKLKSGENKVLVKICQNEQKEPWAQDWMLQLRFTDSTGLAVQPAR
ncbi:MAG: hypothetical protein Aurels2KO_23340 [Aureliella sp.]